MLSINTPSFSTAGLDLLGTTAIAGAAYSQSLTGHGNVLGDVTGAADKTITVSGGTLALGDANSASGFDFAGTLDVASNQVILNDADEANLAVTTTLAVGGSMATINGAELGCGQSLSATGSASVDGNFTNNGIVNGPTGGDETLTFIDDVDGTGSYTGKITFSDAFNPGASPAPVRFENVTIDASAELNIELAGTTPGSRFDQISASVLATLDGTLNISVLAPFEPMVGQSLEGAFSARIRPTRPEVSQFAGSWGALECRKKRVPNCPERAVLAVSDSERRELGAVRVWLNPSARSSAGKHDRTSTTLPRADRDA